MGASKYIRLAVIAFAFGLAGCVQAPAKKAESVQQMIDSSDRFTGADVVVVAHFSLSRHTMLIQDSKQSAQALKVIIPSKARSRSDIEKLIDMGSDGWRGKEVDIVGTFTGRLVADPDTRIAFELHAAEQLTLETSEN